MSSIMKKTFFYNFFPSKNEEINAFLTKRPHQVTQTLIEIRDDNPNPNSVFDPNNNPWRIRKRLDSDESSTGKIRLSHEEVLEHVFHYWPLEGANSVVRGKKVFMSVYDVTDENTPIHYGPYDEQTIFEKGQDGYFLGLNLALVKSRGLKKDDEIGIHYDPRNQCFYVKVFR